MPPPVNKDQQGVPLKDAVQFALDEARMILPGIQALFGFQLIAVFNQRFDEVMGSAERLIFLAALACITLACALVMAPAAYHRQVERSRVSSHLLTLASRLLAAALFVLMIAITCDVYLVTWVVTSSMAASLAGAAISAGMFGALWYVLPLVHLRA